MGMEEYSTEKIMKSSEFEIDALMDKFQAEEVSYLKLGGFLAYNVVALVGLKKFAGRFIKNNWLKRD